MADILKRSDPLDSVADGYSPKKNNLQMCKNYRTISLISHPNKVWLKIFLRLKPQTKEIIVEEQAR